MNVLNVGIHFHRERVTADADGKNHNPLRRSMLIIVVNIKAVINLAAYLERYALFPMEKGHGIAQNIGDY